MANFLLCHNRSEAYPVLVVDDNDDDDDNDIRKETFDEEAFKSYLTLFLNF
jgi:hypothetical protein